MLRPVACAIVPLVSPAIRDATSRNARRIFGRELSGVGRRQFARDVVGAFYDFVVDVGRASRMSASELSGLVGDVEGLDAYRLARSRGRGAILVTAHLGAFETGLAALAREERRIRVVFKRDSTAGFERLRSRLHNTLGVIESPIDDGIDTWLGLRDALLNDEVVVMQGDRAVPGQRSEVVPFLSGHLRLPTGPVRLARMTESPIIPAFTVPGTHGGHRVLLKQPISSEGDDAGVLRALADAIAEVVARYPHHWLALEPMFHEDRADGLG